jgi:hypothetical protein
MQGHVMEGEIDASVKLQSRAFIASMHKAIECMLLWNLCWPQRIPKACSTLPHTSNDVKARNTCPWYPFSRNLATAPGSTV